MRPKGSLDDTDTRIVFMVLQGTRGIREISREIGLSLQPTYRRMLRLRALGLVDWVRDKDGTLHSKVRPVRVGG